MIILPKSVGCLSLACARETARYALAAVHVLAHLEDQWWAEATNGKILAIARGPRLPDGGGPELEIADPTDEFLVAAEDWKKLFQGIDLKGIGKGCIGMACDGHNVHVSTPNGRLLFSLVDGRFPDVGQAPPATAPLLSIKVDPYLLIDMLKIAIGIGDSREGVSVGLHFFGPEKPLAVTVRNAANGQTLDGLLMPMT